MASGFTGQAAAPGAADPINATQQGGYNATQAGGVAPASAPGPRPARKDVASEGRFSTKEAIGLALIPWLAFSCVCLLFAYVYHYMKGFIWFMVIVGSGVCLANGSKNFSKTKINWICCCSAACFVAIIMGATTGLTVYDEYIGTYWFYTENHAYTNVLPSNPAGGYADAGELIFADEAHVDTNRAVGYQDVNRYCVAPIIDDAVVDQVQFWAAGMDCCGQRGGFYCDDSWSEKARSGVVIRDVSVLRQETHVQYLQAVRAAEAAFDLVSASEPIFVRFVIDPELVTLNCWRAGVGILFITSMVFLLISITSAWVVKSVGVK